MKSFTFFSVVMVLSLSSQSWTISDWKTFATWLLCATQQTEGNAWNRYTLVGHCTSLKNPAGTLVYAIQMLRETPDGSIKEACLIKPDKNDCENPPRTSDIQFSPYTYGYYPATSLDIETAPPCHTTQYTQDRLVRVNVTCPGNVHSFYPLKQVFSRSKKEDL